MAEIDAATLLPSGRMRDQALDGEVTQVHRGDRYADVGDTFTVEGTTFEVVAVEATTLGNLTDEDVRKEGARDLDHYRQILERAHENFEWDDGSGIVRHRFEPADA